ncbi:hypothetical protein EVG20_g6008 [Dentipellis fragilis]|uniref:Cullin family profile domain-containing protein n=1 Tax=Dentipellis fragilis TaxID=205917 RepID=A0A4Y9YT48_9AGAM|nr:hypothetical protein EVG20_g6008 [Dentipellis fragilis]
MTDIMSLLTLSDPSESDAFRALRPSAVDEFKSASPPRKVARLDTDSDSGSASRSRAAVAAYRTPVYPTTTGPVRVRVVGEQMKPPSKRDPGEMINKLRRCIKVILTRGLLEKTPPNEEIYTLCQYVVQWADGGASLAGHLKMELERCVGTLQRELFGDIAEGSAWLRPFVETCSWFEERVHHLQQVLTYLDRVYLRSLKEPQSIRELAFDLFTDRIFYHAGIFEKLREGIAEWVQWERNNRQPHRDRPLIADLIKHLEIHQKYPSVFESYYMELTKNYYVAEAAELLSAPDKDALKFFNHTVSRIEEEKQRAKELLPVASWTTAQEMTERALVAEQLPWLAKNALGVLMDKKDTEGLKKLYELFGRVDGVQILLEEFKVFLQSRVKTIVSDAARDDEMVDRLLEFKEFVDATRTGAFVNAPPASLASSSAAPVPVVVNKDFRYAQDDAFALGFKARRNKPAEMIAKHVDRLMRKGQRGASDEAFEAQLDAALALYRFTDDKDVFRTFYHRALAKRLLLERSASDDFEKAMLKKLKEQYDPDFSMGDQMFTDLALSRESMREYHGKLPKDSPAHNLNVMVLQRGVWPFSARKADITLPPSMQSQLTRFGDFYKVKHQGHKLEWDHALGTVTLKAHFKAGPKELSVSLYQGVISLLFNETPEISFKDIKEFTQLEDGELRRTLQSLACGKKKVLHKRPVGKDVNDDDVFEFNESFTDPRAKVHINSIQAKETAEETQRTRSSIEGERKYYLDAAIVRIMKAKKQLTYEQIKTETIEAVKKHFVPEVSSIKKRIASLVEEEYLKRDENDMNLYLSDIAEELAARGRVRIFLTLPTASVATYSNPGTVTARSRADTAIANSAELYQNSNVLRPPIWKTKYSESFKRLRSSRTRTISSNILPAPTEQVDAVYDLCTEGETPDYQHGQWKRFPESLQTPAQRKEELYDPIVEMANSILAKCRQSGKIKLKVEDAYWKARPDESPLSHLEDRYAAAPAVIHEQILAVLDKALESIDSAQHNDQETTRMGEKEVARREKDLADIAKISQETTSPLPSDLVPRPPRTPSPAERQTSSPWQSLSPSARMKPDSTAYNQPSESSSSTQTFSALPSSPTRPASKKPASFRNSS